MNKVWVLLFLPWLLISGYSHGEGKMLAANSPELVSQGNMYKKPSVEILKKKLSSLQYHVTQEEGTERPYENKYWDEKREGIYVDIVSGEPLFSSMDKYDSKTGWPSFSKPLVVKHIIEKKDKRFIWSRTEVRSRYADSHLGHVFNDGPKPLGLRFCINSASMRFVPRVQLISEGYGEYLVAFKNGS